jgi:hypothetical protein
VQGVAGMQEVSNVMNDRRAGRWAVALAATALVAGGGFLGSAGSAQAGDEPDIHNVGSPGQDGGSVTCYGPVSVAHDPQSSTDNPHICSVAANGQDGAPGAVYP